MRRSGPALDGAATIRRRWIGLGVGLLVTAIGLAHLRVETLRLRYQRAEAQRVEAALRDRERSLSLELRRLRDPVRLEKEALRLGLVPPERVLRVPPYASAEPPAVGALR